MKNKIHLWFSIYVLMLLVACQGKPQFINHPQPNLSVTFDVFNDVGCPKDEYGFRSCNSDSPLASLGCNEIRKPSDLIGGLLPSYPIAVCEVYLVPDKTKTETEAEIENGQFFYSSGGMFNSYIRYVVYRNGKFLLIKSENEFQDLFAPIETPEEALSYVLAVKNLSAYYDLKNNPTYEYTISTIEDTHITSETNGYRLHLYYYEVFGCGPHWTSVVEIHVSYEGIIQEIGRKQIFRDPNEDSLCVD